MMKKKRLGAVIVIAVMLTAGAVAIVRSAVAGSRSESRSGLEAEEILLDETFVTSESDKQAKYTEYLEEILADEIVEAYPAVRSADVTLTGGEELEYAQLILELQDEFTADHAGEVADAVATAMGNMTTEHVTIEDSEGNVLFGGESM